MSTNTCHPVDKELTTTSKKCSDDCKWNCAVTKNNNKSFTQPTCPPNNGFCKRVEKIKSDSFGEPLSPITEISANFSNAHLNSDRGFNDGTEKQGSVFEANIDENEKDCTIFKVVDSSNEKAPLSSEEQKLHDRQKITTTSRQDLSLSRLSDMAVDDISFYDDSDQQQEHNLRSSLPPIGLLSPEGSPQRFQIVQSQKLCLSQQKGLILDKLRDVTKSSNGSCLVSSGSRSSSSSSSGSSGSLSRMVTTKNTRNTSATTPAKCFRVFNSLSSGSMESAIDDEYMELFEMEALDDDHRQSYGDDNNYLPSNLNSLISGQIKSIRTSPPITTPEMRRPSVRRCLSLLENNQQLRARTALFEPKTPEILKSVDKATIMGTGSNTPQSSRYCDLSPSAPASSSSSHHHLYCFKRPDPPSTISSPSQSKRFCSVDEKENSVSTPVSPLINNRRLPFAVRPSLRQCMSMNDSDIMSALARFDNNPGGPDLIGDFSKPFCLPLVDGRHRDLKSISSDTVAKLIKGHFDNCVASYTIIDCRYPYEFDGGHIRGAKNLFTQEQIIEEFMKNKTEHGNNATDATATATVGPKRNILVFHCEFSSERGPKLSRFLRNNDRESNTNSYPVLDYPEIYLLHNGYKDFFEKHSELCDPSAYRPMLEPSYNEAYKYFRAKSKSWNGDVKGTASRLKKSRSRLVL